MTMLLTRDEGTPIAPPTSLAEGAPMAMLLTRGAHLGQVASMWIGIPLLWCRITWLPGSGSPMSPRRVTAAGALELMTCEPTPPLIPQPTFENQPSIPQPTRQPTLQLIPQPTFENQSSIFQPTPQLLPQPAFAPKLDSKLPHSTTRIRKRRGHVEAVQRIYPSSPQRIVVATQVLVCLSRDPAAQARRAIPVLRFIETSLWTDPRSDGRLYLIGAYRGASDVTTHAILTERAATNK